MRMIVTEINVGNFKQRLRTPALFFQLPLFKSKHKEHMKYSNNGGITTSY